MNYITIKKSYFTGAVSLRIVAADIEAVGRRVARFDADETECHQRYRHRYFYLFIPSILFEYFVREETLTLS